MWGIVSCSSGPIRRTRGLLFHCALASHCTAAQTALVLPDEEQLVDAVEINEHGRLRQSKVHCRHQALSSGQELGIAAIVREQTQRLVNGARRVVIKGGGFHLACPLLRLHMPAGGGLYDTGATIFYSSTKATARQKAASPPLNSQGKTPRVSRLFCSSGAPICPPMFSTWTQSWGKSALWVS